MEERRREAAGSFGYFHSPRGSSTGWKFKRSEFYDDVKHARLLACGGVHQSRNKNKR